MARQSEGWKLRPDPKTGIQQVRFRHGRRREISTGERDPKLAAERAAVIYAEVVSGRWDRELVISRPGQPFDEVAAEWLFDIKELCKEKSWKTLRTHIKHLAGFFKTLDRVTGTDDYCKARLKEVLRETVKKEITTLRRFMKWAKKKQYIATLPDLEYPPESKPGTPDTKRKHKRKSIPLSRAEARAILAELPATSVRARRGTFKHAVRDFYVVLWETGLRPVTVEQIATLTHYRPGIPEIHIDEIIDKVHYKRDLDITPTAFAAMERWANAKSEGPVFGAHDRRVPFRAACRAAAKKGKLAEWKKDVVTPYDFRHGRTTDLLDQPGATMVGVAYVVGHKQITTTNKYTHPEREQAKAAVMGGVRGGKRTHSGGIRGGKTKQPVAQESGRTVH